MGHGNAGMAGHGEGRRDAGNHFAGDSGRDEGLDLFGPAAEKVRIAALQPHDRFSLPGGGDHPPVDLLLEHLAAAVRMAQRNLFGRRRHVLEQLGIDQVVVEHQVGLGQALGAAKGNQAGIAGTGSDQIDFAVVFGVRVMIGRRCTKSPPSPRRA